MTLVDVIAENSSLMEKVKSLDSQNIGMSLDDL